MPEGAVATGQIKQKVWGATVGSGAGSFVGVIVTWLLKKWIPDLPQEVADAVAGLLALIFAGGGGWLTPPGVNETNIVVDGKAKSALRAS